MRTTLLAVCACAHAHTVPYAINEDGDNGRQEYIAVKDIFGPAIELILFDLDGTLIDSKADLICSVNRMLMLHGAGALEPEIVGGFIGRGMKNLLRQSLRASKVTHIDLSEATITFEEIYTRHRLDETVLYPGVRKTLRILSPYKKIILTNKPKHHADAIVEALGIAPLFDGVFGGDSFEEMKPSPRPVLQVLARYGVAPHDALLVGDSTYDIKAGKAAQVWTCAALYGYHERAALLSCNPDFRVHGFTELPALLP